jgi:hypothetical protein
MTGNTPEYMKTYYEKHKHDADSSFMKAKIKVTCPSCHRCVTRANFDTHKLSKLCIKRSRTYRHGLPELYEPEIIENENEQEQIVIDPENRI